MMLAVGDTKIAAQLRTQLQAVFRNALGQETKTRRITFPGPHGPLETPVTWLPEQRLWGAFPQVELGTVFCWFGCSLPENERDVIGMDVEINFGPGRRGRALLDGEGRLYLGHRGGLGGGRGGQITIAEFVRRIRGFQQQAISRPDGSEERVFVIGAIQDGNFLSSLRSYVHECARLREEARQGTELPPGFISSREADEEPYDPNNVEDGREQVMRAIRTRRGQSAFRQALIDAYDGRCAITGCAVLDVLEAAHITPYLGPQTNHVTNGLLLRADLHTLFDLNLIAINPVYFKLIVDPRLLSSAYLKLQGRKIRLPTGNNDYPSKKALEQHLNDCPLFGD